MVSAEECVHTSDQECGIWSPVRADAADRITREAEEVCGVGFCGDGDLADCYPGGYHDPVCR